MILLSTFWMLYTSYEFMLLSNKNANEFGNLGPKSVRHISKNPSNILRHVHEDKVLPEKHSQNNIHDRQMKIDEPSHSWVNNNQTPKNIEHSENEKLQHFDSKVQQLDKLAEMGGKLVEKKSSGAFSKVILPLFNDQKNSTGPGEYDVIYLERPTRFGFSEDFLHFFVLIQRYRARKLRTGLYLEPIS